MSSKWCGKIATHGRTAVALRLLSIKVGNIGKRLVMGVWRRVRETGENYREALAVACFLLSTLMCVAEKAILDKLCDGGCRMWLKPEEIVIVVHGLRCCQGVRRTGAHNQSLWVQSLYTW